MIIRKEHKHIPHNQIANICGLMKEYRLPVGKVNMPVEDTPAVIAIILYFLGNDEKISTTKLQYQMLLLDNMCLFEGSNDHILDWRKDMKNGIPNLEPFLEHMESKKLVKRSKKQIILLQKDMITEGNFHEKLKNWLLSISERLKSCNVTQTRERVKILIAERTML